MRKFLRIAAGVSALAGSLAAVATPAEARPYGGGRGYYGGGHYGGYGGGYRGYGGYRHGGHAGTAIVAGVAGLALGAALADGPRYGGYYGGPPRAYGYGGGYGGGYYEPRPYYAPHCWTRFQWDPYYGQVPVQVCG